MKTNSKSALPEGSLVALITPFSQDGRVDIAALRRLIEWHVLSGTQGLVVAGTTGEASTLSMKEHAALIATVVEQASGRVHVMAGVGANATTEAIELCKAAKHAGANSLLSVVPYYNKPTQEGMYRHFISQAEATDLPIVLYSVAGRTVVDFTIENLQRMAQHPNVLGIKEASGDLVRAQQVAAAVSSTFIRYSGDDLTCAAAMALGAHGVISVTANVLPAAVQRQCTAIKTGQLELIRELVAELFEVSQALFVETNPIPVKYLSQLMGMCDSAMRSPMVQPNAHSADALAKLLEQSALLQQSAKSFRAFHF